MSLKDFEKVKIMVTETILERFSKIIESLVRLDEDIKMQIMRFAA